MERFQTTESQKEYWEKYVDPEGPIIKTSLYVYGVDYLNTKRILEYFHYFTPSKVEWLNDTSCNVIFPSEDNALQALNTSCLEKISNPEDFDNIKRTAIGYQLKDENIPIYIRFSTENDKKSEKTKAKDSKFYKWSKKNKQHLKNKPITRKPNFKKFNRN